jgi:protein TonB
MSYANRRQMSSNRTVSIVVVALLHLLLGYGLVTGLAPNIVQNIQEELQTFDVEEETPPPPPEDEPPPPPENIPESPPPVVTPPPLVRTNITPPPLTTTEVAPPSAPVTTTAPSTPPSPPAVAPPPPPPPPPPPVKVQPARARANLASYVTDDDYPQDAIRNEQQGTTGFRLEVGPDGRVANCTVTSSSGSSSLDAATCRIMRSRARFTPATDSSGNKVSDTHNGRIRWQIPEE